MQDIRFAIRSLRRTPTFTFVAIVTIALGIGVNAVMFSVTNAVLLRPLPYSTADRLLWLTSANAARGLTQMNVSYTRLMYLQDNARTLDAIGAFAPWAVSIHTSGDPELVPAAIGSANLFDVLGTRLAAGRTFRADEDRAGGADVAIVANEFWRSHLGGRTDVIGSTLAINGRDVTIVGVLPGGFRFPFAQPEPQIWVPRVFEHPTFPPERVNSGAAYLNAIARVAPGQTIASADAELATLARAYNAAFPGNADASGYTTDAAPLQDALVGPLRPRLVVLFSAAGFVLLIACVNVASLLLARGSARQKELAIRRALGASKWALVRSTLTESLVLGLTGGALAILIALNATPLLTLLPDGTLPRAEEVAVDTTVVLFALGLSLVSALMFGLVAARRASDQQVHDTLKDAGRGTTTARAGAARVALVIAEIAIACVLVSSTALLLKSFGRLTAVDPGFDARDVLTFTISLPATRYRGVSEQARFFTRLVDDLAAIPTVDAAAANSFLPISGGTRLLYLCPQGTACQGIGKDPVAAVRHVTPNYFAAMRIPLIRGRTFEARDNASSQRVCIINEKAAEDFFPGENAVGKTLLQSRDNISTVVVGVVRNVKGLGLNGQILREFYVPQEQSSVPVPTSAIVVRTAAGRRPPLDAVKAAVAKLDPGLPLASVRSMDEVVTSSVAQPRLTMWLTESFATLALLLAATGIYGLVAYAVAQRKQEIAVRLAIGAAASDILSLIVKQAAMLTSAGIGVGLAASLLFGEFLRSILFEVSPHDPAAYASVFGVIVVTTIVACYVPARRAMQVDPVAGLRGE